MNSPNSLHQQANGQNTPIHFSKNQKLLILIGLASVAVVCSVLAFYGLQSNLPQPLPKELVGRWEVVDGFGVGNIYEFYENGDFHGIFHFNGRTGERKSVVTIDGDQMRFKTKLPITGEFDVVEQTILKMSADELILEQNGERSVLRPQQ